MRCGYHYDSHMSAHMHTKAIPYKAKLLYRALQVTCQGLEAWLSCFVECHHGNASLNQVTTTPNLIKTLYNLFRWPQLLFLFPISIDK